MRRSVSWLVLLAGLPLALFAQAGDKLPDQALQADAREDVSQALIAEASGDNAERSKRLTKAWLAVPELAEANWHMARVRVAEKWLPLAEVVSQAAQDPDQEQYRALREKAAGNPRALRELARWCAKHDWNDRARLHYAQLLADPQASAAFQSEAVEKLNLVQVNGTWLTKQEVEARQEEAKVIQDSLTKWRPKLKALQQVIDGEDFPKRDKAMAELEKLDDPEMIPALESFLLDGGADFQERAVKRLSGFPHYVATEALVRYAVLPEFSVVRNEATKALGKRPLHEYCPLLLRGLVAPIKSQFEIQRHPNGSVTYTHVLIREQQDKRQTHVAQHIDTAKIDLTTPTGFNSPPGLPKVIFNPTIWILQDKISRERYGKARDIHLAAALVSNRSNPHQQRVIKVLTETTNQNWSDDPARWWTWWEDYNGYHWPKLTYSTYSMSRSYYKTPPPVYVSGGGSGSCFLAGTPVRTEMGTVPIESIRPGNRVLAQDQDTGELSYKVVLTTTIRPPAKMLQIQAGGEDIYTTLGHPFWVSGQGWKMAKQLKEGDLLHGLGGATPIASIAPSGEHEAHNLVVDEENTYFVGRAGLLVHDNEFRKPTRATVPGLVQE